MIRLISIHYVQRKDEYVQFVERIKKNKTKQDTKEPLPPKNSFPPIVH